MTSKRTLPDVIWGRIASFASTREMCTWAATSQAFNKYCTRMKTAVVAPVVALQIGGESTMHDLAVRLALAMFAVPEDLHVNLTWTETFICAIGLLVRACIEAERPLLIFWIVEEGPRSSAALLHRIDKEIVKGGGSFAKNRDAEGLLYGTSAVLNRKQPALCVRVFAGPSSSTDAMQGALVIGPDSLTSRPAGGRTNIWLRRTAPERFNTEHGMGLRAVISSNQKHAHILFEKALGIVLQ